MEGTKFTIDRKIFDSDIWNASPWKFKIFFYLLGKANFSDGNVRGVAIKRGQILTSYRHLRKVVGYKVGYRMKYPAVSTVKSICEELTKDARTTLRTVHQGTLITICNYNDLQPMGNANRTGCRTLAVHLPYTTEEEVKNVKNVKPKNNGRFTPPSVEEVRQYIADKDYHFDPEVFVAHYESNGWVQNKGKPIVNWKAACVTWEKRREENAPQGKYIKKV